MISSTSLINRYISPAVFLVLIIITLAVSVWSYNFSRNQQNHNFYQDLNHELEIIEERFMSYEHFLVAGAAFFAASDSVTETEWKEFIKISKMEKNLPETRNTGIIFKDNFLRLSGYTETDKTESGTCILSESTDKCYVSSFRGGNMNCPELGYDKDPRIKDAMEQALDNNSASITYRIVNNMPRDSGSLAEVVMFVPLYQKDNTKLVRDDQVTGWAFITFDLNDLIIDLFDERNIYYPLARLQVYDNDPLLTDTVLIADLYHQVQDKYPHSISSSIPFDLYGASWNFQFIHSSGFMSGVSFFSFFLLISGIIISILALILIDLLIKTTHRSKAETEMLIAELSGSERLRNAVFDTANVGISIIKDDGDIFLANKWWTDKTGYTREEIQTLPSEVLTFPDDKENSSNIKNRLFSGEITAFRFEKRFLTKDNSIFWGDSSLSVIKLPPDNKMFLINIVTDITERIEAKEIINQKNTELGNVVAHRNRVISTLAHDLKSPFNSLLGFSDLMVENIGTYSAEKIENYLRIINFTTHQTYNLFNDIIAWAKIQSGKTTFNPRNLNFNVLSFQTLKTLLLNAENKRILILESFKKDYWIYADQEMIKSILRNLISNSLKFTNAGGLIKIRCFDSDSMNEKIPESVHNLLTSDPSCVIIAVSDTGIGINPDALSNLFSQSNEYFAKGTADEAGTGIGLTLCKEFVAKHNGKIWAESREGKGSVFYFSVAKGEPDKVPEV